MGSYDFVIAVKFGKNGWPFFGPLCQSLTLFWLFSGLDLAPWQKVDLATLFTPTKPTKCQIEEVPNMRGAKHKRCEIAEA